MSLSTFEFLQKWFHGAEGFIELTFIAPPELKVYPRTVVKWAALPLEELNPAMFDFIASMNNRGYGCYFGVTPSAVHHPPVQKQGERGAYIAYPRRKEKDVTHITGVWLDLDTEKEGVKPWDALYTLNHFDESLKPTIVIHSGGGLHAYYRFKAPESVADTESRNRIKDLMKGMAAAFSEIGADSQAVDMARVLRLPDTINTKPARNGAKCEVYCFKFSRRYTLSDMLITFHNHIPKPKPVIRREIPPTNYANAEYPAWIMDYLQYGAAEGERNHRLYAAARYFNDLGKSESEAEQILGTRAGMDGLEGEEINRTIASAYRAPRSAILNTHEQTRIAIRDRRTSYHGR